MNAMAHLVHAWMRNNLDIVFFVYGAAFVLMGTAIFFQPKRGSSYKISGILWLLAAFGVTHGIHEWIEMWAIIRGVLVADLLILAVSFLFLFEFGLQLLLLSDGKLRPGSRRFLERARRWPYIFIPAVCLVELFYPEHTVTWHNLVRYLLGFPGGLLTGIALFFYYGTEKKSLSGMKAYFFLSGIAFILYGVLGGLVVRGTGLFPANIINIQNFDAVFKVPVQVLRALCALTAGFSMATILNVFNSEMTKQKQDMLDSLGNQTLRLRLLNGKLAEVFSMVSHELKTPLVSIIGFAETLIEKKIPETDVIRYLKIIGSEGRRIETLINEYMDISMIESGNEIIRTEPLNIRDVIRSTVETLRVPEHINIEVRVDETIPAVLANKDRMKQVLINIIENAIKYSGEKGKITITASDPGEFVVIGIKDEGPGIKEEDVKHIFSKFYRSSEQITSTLKGLGLGLAIAKGIVEAQNGSIWVQSEPGQGSEFFFSIPKATSAVPDPIPA